MTDETIGSLIKRLRKERHASQQKLADASGIDREYISQLENEKAGSITLRTARALAKGFGISPEIFLRPSGSETLLYRSPNDVLSDLELSIKAYIPVYAEVSAGPGIIVDYVACTIVKAAPETLRAYKVKGLCLSPEIMEGDILIVDTALSPTSGDLIIVLIDDQASVKRYKEDGEGKKWLEDNHGRYQPDNCHLHGVVTEFVRKAR